eukprot:1075220-Prorocentrum_minimum.AAC.6
MIMGLSTDYRPRIELYRARLRVFQEAGSGTQETRGVGGRLEGVTQAGVEKCWGTRVNKGSKIGMSMSRGCVVVWFRWWGMVG